MCYGEATTQGRQLNVLMFIRVIDRGKHDGCPQRICEPSSAVLTGPSPSAGQLIGFATQSLFKVDLLIPFGRIATPLS